MSLRQSASHTDTDNVRRSNRHTAHKNNMPTLRSLCQQNNHTVCQLPSIKKFDNSLNSLTACEHLALSTNAIEKIAPLPGLQSLKILSLSRNNIKRIEKLDDLSDTLEELWLSYNQIDKLDGCSNMRKLRVLFLANNRIKSLEELVRTRDKIMFLNASFIVTPIVASLSRYCDANCDTVVTGLLINFHTHSHDHHASRNRSTLQSKLRDMPSLEEVLLVGNPCYEGLS
jgi:Leucine-rich repeat (LRR) protein